MNWKFIRVSPLKFKSCQLRGVFLWLLRSVEKDVTAGFALSRFLAKLVEWLREYQARNESFCFLKSDSPFLQGSLIISLLSLCLRISCLGKLIGVKGISCIGDSLLCSLGLTLWLSVNRNQYTTKEARESVFHLCFLLLL